jgi:DNA-binding MarR family transcriptional regulator
METESLSLAPRVAAELLEINRMLALGDRLVNKNGGRRIGPTQRRILAFLFSRSPEHVTLSGLAEGAALSLATASESVKALEKRGLVRKVRSRDDARVIHLSLSVAGRRKAEKVTAGKDHLHATIGRLTQMEQELVLQALKNVQQGMNCQEEKQ